MTFPVKWLECAMLEAVIATKNNFTWFQKHLLIGILSGEQAFVREREGRAEKYIRRAKRSHGRAERCNFVSFPAFNDSPF